MAHAPSVQRHPDLTLRRERHLAELARLAATPGSSRSALQFALEVLADDLSADAAAFWHQPVAGRIRLVADHRWPGPVDGSEYPVAPESQEAYLLESDRAVCAHHPTETRFTPSKLLGELGFMRTLGTRVLSAGRPIGLIGAYRRAETSYSIADAEFIEAVARLVGSVLGDSSSLLDTTSDRDPLTGLVTGDAAVQLVDDALAELPSSLLMIGLDGFAEVNEQAGRHNGDGVLICVADRLAERVDADDVVVRLHGDEFGVIVRGRDETELRPFAEHLIGAIEEAMALDGRSFGISASVGIADIGMHGAGLDVIETAADALHRAKALGRGRVMTAQAPAAAPENRPKPGGVARPAETDEVTRADIDAAIEQVRVVFQPILSADGHELVGVEALARGPVGTRFEQPAVFFAAAETHGRLRELDLAAKRAAFAAPVPESVALFVNVDPSVLVDDVALSELIALWQDSGFAGTVVVELTERSLVDAPGELIRAIRICREAGWLIALDDIGSRAETLTALRLVRPDVAKLDLRLLDRRHSSHAAAVAVALDAHRERWPVHVVAEGVETDEHVQMARDLGANLLQGFKYGRPTPLDDVLAGRSIAGLRPISPGSAGGHLRVATKRHLYNVTRVVEAMATGAESIVLATLQSIDFYTDETRQQYARLARRCGMTGIIGAGLIPGVVRGVHHASIPDGDPLVDEWTVVVLSADGGIALIAHDLRDGAGGDAERLFEYEVTRDPAKIERAANRLLGYF